MVDWEPQSFRVIEGDGAAAGTDESPTEYVGAFLREARQTTGRSLADVAASLCIRAKFLQAIEDGRYEDLPGPTYTVGFIRSYADYLGLDTDALLAQFKTESSGIEGHPELEFPVPSTVGWFPTGKVVASCAVLAVAVFGGWFYLQTEDSVDLSAVPPPPGIKSANKNSGGVAVAAAFAAVTEPRDQASSVVVPAVAAAGDASDNRVDAAAITANGAVSTGSTEIDTSPAADTMAASNGVEQSGRMPVPSPAPVSAEAPVIEAELPQSASTEPQVPTELAGAPPPPAEVAAAAPPVEIVEPPANTTDEPVAASANAVEPPAPPPAAELAATERPSPAPPVPEPVVQVAALPNIPSAGAETNTGGNGRTYGVINQKARVIIGARADSWVQVMDGNQNVVLTRMLRAGDRYLVPDRSDLVMLTGNAGGLIISVDGQQVPRIGSDGAILHNVRLDVDLLKAGRAVIQ